MGGEVRRLVSSAVSFFLAHRARPGGMVEALAGAGGEPRPRCSAGNQTAGSRLLFARPYLGLILTVPVGGQEIWSCSQLD